MLLEDFGMGPVGRGVGAFIGLGVLLSGGVIVEGGVPGGTALMGTYAQTPVMVADGATVYTAYVYADNRPLGGVPTWGGQYDFYLPPYATLVGGGVGVAYGEPSDDRDFFGASPMVVNTLAGPGLASGRLVSLTELVSDTFGDLQWYKFTIDVGAPLGMGNFDLGAATALTAATGGPQAFTEVNIPFTVTGLAGDFNHDGFVGIEDLNEVLGNWNASTPLPGVQAGDFNGDGFVGIEDLNWVLGNWNAGTPPAGRAVVPEPGAVVCFGAGVLGWMGCRRRWG